MLQFEERAQRDILDRVKRAIPSGLDGLRELLRAHREDGWDLVTFLRETEIDLLDVYREGRSWTSLRAAVGLCALPTEERERDALSNVQKLLHVSDHHRLSAWRRLLTLEAPRTELERRLAAMLFVILYGRFKAAHLGICSQHGRRTRR